jgi:hypothetical protein
MKTREEVIAELKTEYPTLRTGSEEDGYVDLTPTEYEAIIAERADNLLADEAKAALLAQAESDKAALLAKLGITADEAKLLMQ